MFKGLREEYIQVNKGTIFCRIGGEGTPIKVWQSYTTEKVSDCAMPIGHFIPEEDPKVQ